MLKTQALSLTQTWCTRLPEEVPRTALATAILNPKISCMVYHIPPPSTLRSPPRMGPHGPNPNVSCMVYQVTADHPKMSPATLGPQGPPKLTHKSI